MMEGDTMTLEEAKEKILKGKYLVKIGRIKDYPDFWVFEDPESMDDCSPPAILKKDGRVFGFFYPKYADIKYSIIYAAE